MKSKGTFYKWELVGLLWLAFFLNQGDRQIYNVVMPLIGEDLVLTDVQLGLVATVFTLLYGLMVPLAGYAGDVFQRKWVVFFSIFLFSLGTVFTGLSQGFILLIVFRSVATGVGEAFYYPASNTLIAEYHAKTRAQAMSIHQTANYLGIVASGFLAGYIAERFGWRVTFYAFGGVGLFWSVVLAWRLRADTPGTSEAINIPVRVNLAEAFRYALGKPTLILLSLAFGGMIFVHVGYLTWMPTFLHEKFDLSLANAGFSSVFYHHLLALVGVLLGGKLSDEWVKRRKTARLQMEYISLLLGAPFIFWMGSAESAVATYVALAGFGFFRGMYDSNLFAALYDVIEPRYRSSATGLMLSFAFIVGALSPLVLGWFKSTVGLSWGLSALSGAYLLSALLIFVAQYRFFDRDYVSVDTHQLSTENV